MIGPGIYIMSSQFRLSCNPILFEGDDFMLNQILCDFNIGNRWVASLFALLFIQLEHDAIGLTKGNAENIYVRTF